MKPHLDDRHFQFHLERNRFFSQSVPFRSLLRKWTIEIVEMDNLVRDIMVRENLPLGTIPCLVSPGEEDNPSQRLRLAGQLPLDP